MNKEIRNTILTTDKIAQYDESAKRLLGQKYILAHILVKTVDEFMGMNPKEVVSYIEGEPYISTVPIEPGMTNRAIEKEGQRIIGLNSESQEIYEGMIRYDIIFYVRMKNGLSQMIINVETQKNEPQKYDILNRAIFYVSRMISLQKERDFVNSNYNDIKQVYSIWVCMNMPENTLEHIHFTKDSIVNTYHWKGRLDLVNIVMIGLANELPEQNEKYELHRLLCALFSKELTVNKKLDIISKEYQIPFVQKFEEDVSVMCNLGEGIKEEAEAEAKAEMTKKVVMNMHQKGYTSTQIVEIVEMTAQEVETFIKENGCD